MLVFSTKYSVYVAGLTTNQQELGYTVELKIFFRVFWMNYQYGQFFLFDIEGLELDFLQNHSHDVVDFLFKVVD